MEADAESHPGVLSAASCARLRDAVNGLWPHWTGERSTVADSVDGLPEHQLRLSARAYGGERPKKPREWGREAAGFCVAEQGFIHRAHVARS